VLQEIAQRTAETQITLETTQQSLFEEATEAEEELRKCYMDTIANMEKMRDLKLKMAGCKVDRNVADGTERLELPEVEKSSRHSGFSQRPAWPSTSKSKQSRQYPRAVMDACNWRSMLDDILIIVQDNIGDDAGLLCAVQTRADALKKSLINQEADFKLMRTSLKTTTAKMREMEQKNMQRVVTECTPLQDKEGHSRGGLDRGQGDTQISAPPAMPSPTLHSPTSSSSLHLHQAGSQDSDKYLPVTKPKAADKCGLCKSGNLTLSSEGLETTAVVRNSKRRVMDVMNQNAHILQLEQVLTHTNEVMEHTAKILQGCVCPYCNCSRGEDQDGGPNPPHGTGQRLWQVWNDNRNRTQPNTCVERQAKENPSDVLMDALKRKGSMTEKISLMNDALNTVLRASMEQTEARCKDESVDDVCVPDREEAMNMLQDARNKLSQAAHLMARAEGRSESSLTQIGSDLQSERPQLYMVDQQSGLRPESTGAQGMSLPTVSVPASGLIKLTGLQHEMADPGYYEKR
ncbi:hypothetical protein BaRGS_00009440, partial [Batillaria attramentaria]